ncbi:MAG: hypothetical protein SVW02_00595 [Candidatus Nanohaloarchaea archaeon]|nr:hypothetical protein [Candidatus Nanohaloarchaea archaeon]
MRNKWKSIGVSTGLILLNVAVMGVIGVTPIADLVLALFSTLIVGVLVYGAILTGGTYLAQRGVENDDMTVAGIGVALLQVGYGSFGGALLSLAPASLFLPILATTAAVTGVIAAGAAGLVYGTGRDFSGFRRYATYCFLGVLLFALIGTFTPALAVIAFLLALTGFLLLLVHEIWQTRTRPDRVLMNGIGIYNAFMGVFVHILRIVAEMYLRRE